MLRSVRQVQSSGQLLDFTQPLLQERLMTSGDSESTLSWGKDVTRKHTLLLNLAGLINLSDYISNVHVI